MAYQMEELAERKMELEMKKQEQKQRRQASGSNHALSFLSVFSPVIAPVASAVSAFASASENELRRLIAQIDSLRKQTLELNPASIEIALKDLNAEHQALHLSMESASSHFSAMESEKSAIEVQLIEIEKVHETLDKVCGEIADVQKEVADTEAMVMDAGERAGKAKMIAVMAVGEMSRMGYEQNKRKARGTVREVVEVVRDLELMGLLEKVKGSDDEDSQMDEGIGSSGEDAMTEVEEIDLGLVEDGDIEILEERRDTGLTSGEIDLDIIEEEEEEEQEDSDRESIEDEPFTPLLRKESFDRDDVVSVRDLEEEAFVTGRAQGLAIEDAYAEQQPEATTSVQPSTPVGIEVPEEDIPQLSITITDTTPNAVTVATQTENDSIAESYDEDMFHSPMMGPQSVVLGEDGSSVHRAVPGGFPSSPRKLSMEVVEKKSVVEVREVVLEFA
ncbi:Protein of unknown function [Pyronema omphalodes CBS 100304]|uniref:Uncharacterized protein n=1 Tax=Pyronema omphalodes (strain CBS 100304) TaxID=1076935 RepID=U4L6U2_PYROM|nr:Protein of unknown function [Pyronema omphalodes CBS 100304]